MIKRKLFKSHNFKISQQTNKPIRYCCSPQAKAINNTMAHLQSFMSDFLYQCDCSSIDVVSDNARTPQQQEQQAAPASGRSVSPRHFENYKRITRWDSGVEAISPPLGPPVRR
jgi:hypothetical protein